MRRLTIIVGLGSVLTGLCLGMTAGALCFSRSNPTGLSEYLPIGGLITLVAAAIFAVGCLMLSRNVAASPRTLKIMILAIACGLVPAVYVLSNDPLADNYSRGGTARYQIQELERAIVLYKAEHGHFPIPTNLFGLNSGDFTFGTYQTSAAKFGITNSSGPQANNSEIIAILLAWTNCPNFLQVSNVKRKYPGTNAQGVLLDPWGNPYIITLDLNGDDHCRDAIYRLASVSELNDSAVGFRQLTRPGTPPFQTPAARDTFEAPGPVMIWSCGLDGKASRTDKAGTGVNKDNVVKIAGKWW